MLADSKQVKNLPGRPKRDPADSRWLADPGMRHEDLGPDYCDRQRDTRRQIAHHVGELGALGFEATICRIREPDPDRTSPAQAA